MADNDLMTAPGPPGGDCADPFFVESLKHLNTPLIGQYQLPLTSTQSLPVSTRRTTQPSTPSKYGWRNSSSEPKQLPAECVKCHQMSPPNCTHHPVSPNAPLDNTIVLSTNNRCSCDKRSTNKKRSLDDDSSLSGHTAPATSDVRSASRTSPASSTTAEEKLLTQVAHLLRDEVTQDSPGESGSASSTPAPDNFPPPYTFHGRSVPVSMLDRAWDTILNNLRIAMETDNFFLCDHFLGQDLADAIHSDLLTLKNKGYFNSKLSSIPVGFGKSLYLEKPNAKLHKSLDCLVALTHKLTHAYNSSWKHFSVEITYFRPGERLYDILDFTTLDRKYAMKCVYFPNKYTSNMTHAPRLLVGCKGRFGVDLNYDRLVTLWADSSEGHQFVPGRVEMFMVTFWLFR